MNGRNNIEFGMRSPKPMVSLKTRFWNLLDLLSIVFLFTVIIYGNATSNTIIKTYWISYAHVVSILNGVFISLSLVQCKQIKDAFSRAQWETLNVNRYKRLDSSQQISIFTKNVLDLNSESFNLDAEIEDLLSY